MSFIVIDCNNQGWQLISNRDRKRSMRDRIQRKQDRKKETVCIEYSEWRFRKESYWFIVIRIDRTRIRDNRKDDVSYRFDSVWYRFISLRIVSIWLCDAYAFGYASTNLYTRRRTRVLRALSKRRELWSWVRNRCVQKMPKFWVIIASDDWWVTQSETVATERACKWFVLPFPACWSL